MIKKRKKRIKSYLRLNFNKKRASAWQMLFFTLYTISRVRARKNCGMCKKCTYHRKWKV